MRTVSGREAGQVADKRDGSAGQPSPALFFNHGSPLRPNPADAHPTLT
jgi:hypothetical protein